MKEVQDFLVNRIKLNKDDVIVVGVSAGPDSMALLYILQCLRKKIGFNIIVAHVNHHVRMESNEEYTFLEQYCRDNNLVFEGMVIEKYGDDNFHNEARCIRYHFYDELIIKYGANYLMTGHHGDDLMETILMRIVRGSTLHGYSGFSAITKKSNYQIVRPLITVTKKELEEFDKENKVPYRIDNSNLKDKYTRNRYRKYVLPFLKEEDKDVHKKFLKFSQTLQEYDALINRLVNLEMDSVYKDGIINIDEFKKCDTLIAKRIIEHILSLVYYDDITLIDDRHIELILKCLYSKKASLSYNLPDDYLIVKEYNRAYLKKMIDAILPYDVELIDTVYLPNGLTIEKVDDTKSDSNAVMRLNSNDIVLPLHVRTRCKGDRMTIKNMKGTRKVSDILIDAKVPLHLRDSWPIVVDSENKILWIPNIKKSKYNRRKQDKCDIIFKCY